MYCNTMANFINITGIVTRVNNTTREEAIKCIATVIKGVGDWNGGRKARSKGNHVATFISNQ